MQQVSQNDNMQQDNISPLDMSSIGQPSRLLKEVVRYGARERERNLCPPLYSHYAM